MLSLKSYLMFSSLSCLFALISCDVGQNLVEPTLFIHDDVGAGSDGDVDWKSFWGPCRVFALGHRLGLSQYVGVLWAVVSMHSFRKTCR
jgi:hypothetical protein